MGTLCGCLRARLLLRSWDGRVWLSVMVAIEWDEPRRATNTISSITSISTSINAACTACAATTSLSHVGISTITITIVTFTIIIKLTIPPSLCFIISFSFILAFSSLAFIISRMEGIAKGTAKPPFRCGNSV